jgi:uncharacterized protein
VVIDALRGYFIVWIGLYNTFAVFNAIKPNLVLSSILLFINDKGWFCLSAIFGYGFGILIKRDDVAKLAFPRRMFLLFLLGLFNNLFFYGDILKEYTIIGLILFYGRTILSKYPYLSVFLILILTLFSLYFIPFDMQKAGDINSIFRQNNPILANLKYCFKLNIHSSYYAICFHLEILLMAYTGFMMSFFNVERLIIINQSKLFWGSLFMMFLALFLSLFVIDKDNPIFIILFFTYIFSLATWFVISFYKLFKKYKFMSHLFVPFGRRSLTIYLVQNVVICSVWFLNKSLLITHFSTLFWTYCGIQLVILVLSRCFSLNGIGVVEMYWRKWSS